MKILFFVVFFLLLVYLLWDTFHRGWLLLPAKGQIRTVFTILYITLSLAMFSGIFLESIISPGAAKILTFIGYSFFLLVIYMMISNFVVDIIGFAGKALKYSPQELLTFRKWFAAISLVSILIVMVIGNYKFNNPEIVKLDITSDKPDQGKRITIAVASDIHMGVSIDKNKLAEYVDLINSTHPDMILLPGDITDRSIGPVMEQNMEEELSKLKAPMGVYLSFGNHEYYSGKKDEIKAYYEMAGIKVLNDSVCLADSGLYIIGREDYSNKERKPLNELMEGLDIMHTKILLDHQPADLNDALRNNVDLQVSGHTHFGQFFPANLITKMIFELAHGYKKKGSTHFYVSSGLGIWGPQYRIGSRSELLVIDFKY